MIELHQELEYVDDNVTIWRYMSTEKFLLLMGSQELHFHRVDRFKDNKECTLSTIDKGLFRYSAESEHYWENERKRHFINCWIESPCELALMWDSYGNKGVAIKSSVKSLRNSFIKDLDHKIYLSRVRYIDFDKDSSHIAGAPKNILKIVFTKRKFFNQEREIRLLYSHYDSPRGEEEESYDFKCDIPAMIEEIKLAPNISHENEDKIRSFLKREGMLIPINKSEI